MAEERCADYGSDISLLHHPPANKDFAFSWIISQATGFQYSRQTVSAAQLPTVAAQLASQGRVITAISFDGDGNVMLFSYSWQDDTAVYDAKVTFADLDTYATAAQELSPRGYIITAVGGGNDDSQGTPQFGIVLVGTRVQGDSLPRPMKIVSGQDLVQLINQGF
ncbi:MAG TPA: hypothetical protein VHP11_03210, partial [Tepidisphaeraceae bacterium]|nr:hypothetical protein [Tepidisphaeraceae bacterium]